MHNEELETAFRQTAELLDRLGTRLENDPAVNQRHAVTQLTRYVASEIHSARRFSRIHTTDSELNETLLTHQLANLSRAGRHFHTLGVNLNRQDPEIGRRYGDHLEATAHSIGELRWQVRENFAQFSSSEPRTATKTGRLVLLTAPIMPIGSQPSQEVNTLCQAINTIRPTPPSARTVTLKNKLTQLPP